MSEPPGGYCPRCGRAVMAHDFQQSMYPAPNEPQWRTVVCADGGACVFAVAAGGDQ